MEDEERRAALNRLYSMARGVLEIARAGGKPLVRAPDEVAVARALREVGATDEEMRRIRFSHDPQAES